MAKKKRERKDKDQRVKEILDAAKQVFFERGYFSATVEEIARRASISKGTVYLYFKDKDELYVSLMRPMIEEYTRLLLSFENDLLKGKYKTGYGVLMGFKEVYRGLFDFDPEGIRVFQVYLSTDLFKQMPEETRNLLWLIGKRNIRIAREIALAAMKMGLLPEVDTMRLLDVLWSSFLGIVQWEDSKYRISGKNYFVDTLEYFFDLISNGLGIDKDPD